MAIPSVTHNQLNTARGPLPFTLVRSNRKSLGLRVSPRGVEVRAPLEMSQVQILAILATRHDWLWRHLDRLAAHAPSQAQAALEQVWLLGKPLPVSREQADRPSVVLEPDRVRVCGARDDAHARQLLEQRYRSMAERLFAERLALFAPRWQRAPSMFKLSSAKGRWGSCTQARVIRLSWRLLFAPLAVIDYVIAHELAHCLEMNHSAAFWVEVGRLYPDWAAQRAWLKQHGQYAPQW